LSEVVFQKGNAGIWGIKIGLQGQELRAAAMSAPALMATSLDRFP
jgi:hypothetical protein